MAQVLPYVPSFGEHLVPVLSQAGKDIGQGIESRRAKTALEKLLSPRKIESQGTPSQQSQNQPQQPQYGQSPIEEMFSKEGGPSLGEIINLQNTAEKAFPGAGKTAMEFALNQQKSSQKEGMEIRKENRARQNAIVTDIQKSDAGKREAIRKQQGHLSRGLAAVRTGEVGGVDTNYFANLIGPVGEPFKNLSGVQLDSAMKNFLIEDVAKITGQKNQWIEQRINSAIAGIGKTNEANETLLTISKNQLDIDEKLLDIKDELIQKYESQGIAPPSNIEKLASDILKPYAQEQEDRLAYDLRTIYEKSKGVDYLKNLVKVPPGTPLTLEKRDALLKKYNGDRNKVIEVAEKLGYKIPSSKVVLRQNQNQQP